MDKLESIELVILKDLGKYLVLSIIFFGIILTWIFSYIKISDLKQENDYLQTKVEQLTYTIEYTDFLIEDMHTAYKFLIERKSILQIDSSMTSGEFLHWLDQTMDCDNVEFDYAAKREN